MFELVRVLFASSSMILWAMLEPRAESSLCRRTTVVVYRWSGKSQSRSDAGSQPSDKLGAETIRYASK